MKRSRLDLDGVLPRRRRSALAAWLAAAVGLGLGFAGYFAARPPQVAKAPPAALPSPGQPGRPTVASSAAGEPDAAARAAAAPPGAAVASPGASTAGAGSPGASAAAAGTERAGEAAPAPASGSDAGAALRTYRVRRGDTLAGIAARPDVYGDRNAWRRIYDANRDRLRDPDRLVPGQTLVIP